MNTCVNGFQSGLKRANSVHMRFLQLFKSFLPFFRLYSLCLPGGSVSSLSGWEPWLPLKDANSHPSLFTLSSRSQPSKRHLQKAAWYILLQHFKANQSNETKQCINFSNVELKKLFVNCYTFNGLSMHLSILILVSTPSEHFVGVHVKMLVLGQIPIPLSMP